LSLNQVEEALHMAKWYLKYRNNLLSASHKMDICIN